MVGLKSGADSITINGGPNVDLAGCNLRGNGNLVCNGANSDTGVVYGTAGGSSNCGDTPLSSQGTIADPYGCTAGACLRNEIPPNTCGTLKANYSGTTNITGTILPEAGTTYRRYCGNVSLSGDVTISGTGTKVVIYNGSLNLNGKTFTGTSTTLIFSGLNPTNNTGGSAVTYTHAPVFPNGSGGTLSLAGPDSGPLKGVAMMQNEDLSGSTHALDIDYSGNRAHMNITGLVYVPHGDFQISGNIHPTGLHCIGVVANTIRINGNGAIFNNAADGDPTEACGGYLDLPKTPGSRQLLVG
jgi:hypothetical protein